MTRRTASDRQQDRELRRLVRALRENRSFLVAGHMNMEGDSLGALIGVYYLLKGMGKRVVAYCNDPPPQNLAFLSRHVKVVTKPPRGSFDAGIIVDSPVLSRLGRPAALFGKLPVLITIDHHISNTRFGHINWVDPDASSAGEMVFRLYEAMKRPRPPQARLAIYTAVVTDTGSFRYENTSARTHEVVARLIEEGIRPRPVSEMIYEMATISRIKLLGMALNTLGRSKDGRVAWLYVTRAMQKKARAVPGDTEGFVDFARSLEGVEVAVFLRERLEGPGVKVSFRAKGRADVNRIASQFRGGGHRAAAGCEFSIPLKKALARVLKAVGGGLPA